MGLPVQSNRTQEGCTPISSNCVLYQGPEIPCLNLCPGDSISDVTAKLAEELCDLLRQVDITTFDLTCFNPICPTLTNFHDLVQFIIGKLCDIQNNCCGGSTGTSNSTRIRVVAPGQDCPDCLVTVAPCFYTQDVFGNTITQMQLTDYAGAIGVKVCFLTNQIANINIVLSQQQSQINNLQITVGNLPIPIPLPVFLSTCLTDKFPVIPPTGIPIADLVAGLQQAFCELRSSTGFPTNILNSILRQCVSLDTSPSLNQPGVNMGSLPGWIGSGLYSTLADSVNNMWITICDMRASVNSILTNCCPQGCEGLILQLQTTLVSSTLNLFWTGSGAGFTDCNPSGSVIVITDSYGNSFTTSIPIIPQINRGAYAINLSGTPLNTGTNLSISIQACFNNASGATCERCIETTIINQSVCPALTLDSDAQDITYSFNNNISGAVTYTLTLKLGPSTIDSHVIVAASPGPITGIFSGLLPGVTYTITIQININGQITNTCPIGVITTKDLLCNPPTAVTAVAIV